MHLVCVNTVSTDKLCLSFPSSLTVYFNIRLVMIIAVAVAVAVAVIVSILLSSCLYCLSSAVAVSD